MFWFCPPQSGAPNFRPPGRQTQTQVRNFNAISRSPAGFVKVPFVSPAPLQATQKGKTIIVFCDALSKKKVFFCILCSEPVFLHLCFWPFLPLYVHNFQFLHFLRVQVLHQSMLEGETPNCQSTLPIDKLQTAQFSGINVTQV